MSYNQPKAAKTQDFPESRQQLGKFCASAEATCCSRLADHRRFNKRPTWIGRWYQKEMGLGCCERPEVENFGKPKIVSLTSTLVSQTIAYPTKCLFWR